MKFQLKIGHHNDWIMKFSNGCMLIFNQNTSFCKKSFSYIISKPKQLTDYFYNQMQVRLPTYQIPPSMWVETAVGIALLITIIAIIIFLLIREVNCWYWKISERLSTQKQILKTLQNIEQKLQNMSEQKNMNAELSQEESTK